MSLRAYIPKEPKPERVTSYVQRFSYGREERERLEAPNRVTIKAIFHNLSERKRVAENLAYYKANYHDRGIHMPGPCPFCPNVYYD
jgi:hypothetical protein